MIDLNEVLDDEIDSGDKKYEIPKEEFERMIKIVYKFIKQGHHKDGLFHSYREYRSRCCCYSRLQVSFEYLILIEFD